MKQLLFFILAIISLNSFARTEFNITDFGAKGDNRTLNTEFIQAAIDKCSETGGGTVIVPKGQFLSASVQLKSNVELFLEPGAVLRGIPDIKSYKKGAFIFAEDQHHISIAGTGKIDGQGDHQNFHSGDYLNGLPGRPHAIWLKKCRHITLQNFYLTNSACWCVRLQECEYVTADKLTIQSRVVANNDGIDVGDCHNVSISNCKIDCGDDAICPKSDSHFGVENLTVTNCIMKSESNGIKFGTGSIGYFKNITISNCVVYDTRLSGIALEVVDGGTMENVAIQNITMENVNGGIFVKLGHRNGDTPGVLRNVKIDNVIATGIGLWQPDTTARYYKVPKGSPLIGMTILGLPGYEVENLTLSNISLEFAGGGTLEDAKRKIKDRPAVYPEYEKSGITPAYGISVKHARGICFSNIELSFVTEDLRPAFYLKNVKDAELSHLKMEISEKSKSFIKLEDVEGCFVNNCRPVAPSVSFMEFEGEVTGVSALGNDLSKVKGAYVTDKETRISDIMIK